MSFSKVDVLAVLLIGTTVALAASARSPVLPGMQPTQPAHDYPVQPVPFTAVHLNDVFWAPRIETNRTVTIPVGVPAVRADRPRQQLRARGAGAARRAADDKQAAAAIRSTTPTSTR